MRLSGWRDLGAKAISYGEITRVEMVARLSLAAPSDLVEQSLAAMT